MAKWVYVQDVKKEKAKKKVEKVKEEAEEEK